MDMLNDQQKQNLRHLYNFIKTTPKATIESGFDMSGFCGYTSKDGLGVEEYIDVSLRDQLVQMVEQLNIPQHTCGSSKCLIGWSASVPELIQQIPFDKFGDVEMGWDDLAYKLFGVSHDDPGVGSYLFSADWGDREDTNTIEHALDRIERVLAAETEADYEILEELFDEGV